MLPVKATFPSITQPANVALFVAEGGIELLNTLARSRSATVQTESAQAFGAFCRAPEAHAALARQGGLASLVILSRGGHAELQSHVVHAWHALTETKAPKTWLVQSGCVPALFAYIRNGSPEVRYFAAKALLYMR